MEAYLDNSATTQPCKEAVDKMNYALKTCWGNPSSLHAKGIAASELIEDSRRNVAKALSCESSEIYFTSGGTESNNIAVFGAANGIQSFFPRTHYCIFIQSGCKYTHLSGIYMQPG